ncbi:MAG TPA: hypothetical protein VEU47_14115 [Candidatus Cybelea sp.]|nr:hypothetical protein [Candidatus Cybelea sp.]
MAKLRCVRAPLIAIVQILFVSMAAANDADRGAPVSAGVIFSSSQAERIAKGWPEPSVAGDYWTPSAAEIADLERVLPGYLAEFDDARARAIAGKLATYKRQYLGYVDHGEKFIWVNAFCDDFASQTDWTERLVVVLDGGTCFFNVRYSAARMRFERLMINGEA